MNKRTKHITALVAVAAVLVGSVALAQGESTSPPPQAGSPDASYTQAESLFGALRGPSVEVPADVARGIPTEIKELGLDPGRAVAVPAPAGETDTDTWYLVPGTNGVCVATPLSTACNTFRQLEVNGSIWFVTPTKNPEGVTTDQPESEQAWIVRGIAPDGVATVTASGEGRGVTGSTEPNQGAFLLNLPHGGDTLTLSSAGAKTIHVQHVGRQANGG